MGIYRLVPMVLRTVVEMIISHLQNVNDLGAVVNILMFMDALAIVQLEILKTSQMVEPIVLNTSIQSLEKCLISDNGQSVKMQSQAPVRQESSIPQENLQPRPQFQLQLKFQFQLQLKFQFQLQLSHPGKAKRVREDWNKRQYIKQSNRICPFMARNSCVTICYHCDSCKHRRTDK